MKGMLVGVTAAFVLAGCGEASSSSGAGVEVSSGERQSVADSDTLEQTRVLESARRRAATTETLALPFMLDVIRGYAPIPAGSPKRMGWPTPGQYGKVMCWIARGVLTWDDVPKQDLSNEAMEAASWRPDVPRENPMGWMAHASQSEAAASCAAYGVIGAIEPVVGWPSEVADEILSRGAGEMATQWMGNSLASGVASAALLSPISRELAQQPAMGEDETRAFVRDRLTEQAGRYLEKYQQVIEEPRHYRADATNPQGVHFQTGDGYDVQMGSHGVVVARNGVDWFGNGYLEGERTTLTLTQANTASMGRSAGSSSTVDSSSEQASSAAGGVR
ncbi:hypothetical protein ACT3T8_18035 [Halomonas sp. AOP1-B1-8]|uniref:hypothetical protein n=1 Tax=Halomonas sp. AOP1-B1-8 TaxID=3457726 RepID=UPI004034D1EE